MASEILRVLLIEDDKTDAEMVRICLSEPDAMGIRFELTIADLLDTGLKRLRESDYDVVLLDLMLPDGQGLESLLQVLPLAVDCPVLVMTGLEEQAVAQEAIRLGAQDFILKSSFDSRHLKRAIWYAIERLRLLAEPQSILRRAADGLVVVDEEGKVLYTNPAAEALLRKSAAELAGRPFPYPVALGAPAQVTIDGGKEGGGRVAEMRVTEIQWRGARALLASLRDITELRKLEQLKAEIKERRKADRLKDDLLAGVSHELRTPLTIVKSAIESLREGVGGPLNPAQEKTLGLACRNAARLARMVNNLLDLSRLEAGGAEARRRRMSLSSCFEDALAGCRGAAQERGIQVKADLAGEVPDVDADPDLIVEVLTNLLDNAVRYARTRVTLRAKPAEWVEGAGRGAVVEVTDDGPGIPPDKVGDLFNKFVQIARPTGGAGYKGTGLGLAICKQIMALHGSAIEVLNVPGLGACFRFALPEYAEPSQPLPKGGDANDPKSEP